MDVRSWLLQNITLQVYDDRKSERLNALTHTPGIIMGLASIIAFLMRDGVSFTAQAGSLVFSFSMVFLYSSSTFYHLSSSDIWKRVFRILDHTAIYFLIAGSYTPIIMLIPGNRGLMILAINWGLVFLGITFTIVFWGRLKPLHVIIYILMGWLIVFFWSDFLTAMPDGFFNWLLAGGIAYTSGTLIYAMKKLPYYHAWWHLVVLTGTVIHMMGIYFFIV